MKNHITLPKIILLCAAFFGVGLFGVLSRQASALPTPAPIVAAAAADITDQCDKGFFGLKPWYHFMPKELGVPKHGDVPADPCGVRCFNIFVQANPNPCGQTQSDLPGVVLAIIDDLLRIAALIAIVYMFIGAFEYVGSRGNSEKTASAQSTLISALTGLAIALVAVALVSFIGNRLQ